MNNEEKILEAIAQLRSDMESRLDKVDARLDKVDARLDKIETRLDKVETDVSGVRILVDVDIEKKLKLLAEGQQAILDTMTPKSRTEELEDKYAVLHAAVAQHSWEIAELKKAQ